MVFTAVYIDAHSLTVLSEKVSQLSLQLQCVLVHPPQILRGVLSGHAPSPRRHSRLAKLLKLRLEVVVLAGKLCDVGMVANHVLELIDLLTEKVLGEEKRKNGLIYEQKYQVHAYNVHLYF